MFVSAEIRSLFGRFENLNLLALRQDLRDGRIARQAWQSGSYLCPMAHGLPSGSRVRELRALGHAADVDMGCHFAARLLGAEPDAVMRFVHRWDGGIISNDWLLQQLEEVWTERRADAEVVQAVLQGQPSEGRQSEQTAVCRGHAPP